MALLYNRRLLFSVLSGLDAFFLINEIRSEQRLYKLKIEVASLPLKAHSWQAYCVGVHISLRENILSTAFQFG